MLQQLVLLRPDLVIPVEQILQGMLTSPRLHVVTPMRERPGKRRVPADKQKRR